MYTKISTVQGPIMNLLGWKNRVTMWVKINRFTSRSKWPNYYFSLFDTLNLDLKSLDLRNVEVGKI